MTTTVTTTVTMPHVVYCAHCRRLVFTRNGKLYPHNVVPRGGSRCIGSGLGDYLTNYKGG